jgi:hypothetical protein
VSSLSKAALLYNKLDQILESSSQFKPEIVAMLNKQPDIKLQVKGRNDTVRAQSTVKESTTYINPANL